MALGIKMWFTLAINANLFIFRPALSTAFLRTLLFSSIDPVIIGSMKGEAELESGVASVVTAVFWVGYFAGYF